VLIPDYISDFLLIDASWRAAFEAIPASVGDSLSRNAFIDSLGVISVMLNEAPVGIMVISIVDKILLINRAAEELMEYDRKSGSDMTWAKMRLRKNLRTFDRRPLAEELDPVYVALRERRRNATSILVKSLDESYERGISMTAFPVFNPQGLVIACALVMQDISDLMDMQEIMHDRAIHDSLTGLSNRSVFSGDLAMAIARSKRNKSGGAVLVIDLDRFKKINDVFGLIAGDDLLIKVSRRLYAEVRGTDSLSRFGDDEFAILLADIADKNILTIVADISRRICASIGIIYRVVGKEIPLTASIGISLYPQDGQDEKVLISNAAEAMYHVKANGRNNWQFYHDLEKSAG